jgi:hypothetical protein
MSIRTFLFCDVCNPRGIRAPEQRRDMRHRETDGRRISDARSWFEGDAAQAVNENNWVALDSGLYVCPSCNAKGLSADNMNRGSKSGLRSFVFCDSCNPQGFRMVENRRNDDRSVQTGRRLTDGRAWLDTTAREVILEHDWIVTDDDKHYCPKCVKLHPSLADA